MILQDRQSPSKEALMEIFQTPNPDLIVVAKWKLGWKFKAGRVKVDNYTTAIKLLRSMPDIDPLFYQIATDEVSGKNVFVVFYKPEHEAYFKLHQGLG